MVPLRNLQALRHVVHSLDHLVEVRGTVEVGIVNGVLVGFQDAVEALALGIEDVAVEGEAVRAAARVVDTYTQFSTESKRRKLLVGVIELQDLAHRAQRLIVLIFPEIRAVQGRWIRGAAIAEREINRNGQVDLAATENVLEESVTLLYLCLLQIEHAIGALYDGQLVRFTVVPQLLHIQIDAANVLVSAIFLRNKELNLDVLGLIGAAHVRLHEHDLVELEERVLPTR